LASWPTVGGAVSLCIPRHRAPQVPRLRFRMRVSALSHDRTAPARQRPRGVAIFMASESPALWSNLFWLIVRCAAFPASPSEASEGQEPSEDERKPAAVLWPPCSGSRDGAPFLAQCEAVSPSMTVAATDPRRPRNAHSSVLGRHISIMASAE
jgi:hypothetical protein